MADVTDAAFRQMFVRYGKPDVIWTEFVSADGLFLATPKDSWRALPDVPEMRRIQDVAERHGIARNHPLLLDLLYFENERPIIAQFFSTDPNIMRRAGAFAREAGFDGIDLNMGCPADVICRQGSGAAMIKTPDRAREVIRATKEGAGNLPVSVKTRVGFNEPSLDSWVPALLEEGIDALTVHARTKKEMSKVPARWEFVREAVRIRNTISPKTLIIGNGDVLNLEDARSKANEFGPDGIMVGRGIFGSPWFFSLHTPTPLERLTALREHTELFEELIAGHKSFALMKKHVKAYVNGWDGAKEARERFMEAETPGLLVALIEEEIARLS
jgi:tRNA-dihydrouridine synthase